GVSLSPLGKLGPPTTPRRGPGAVQLALHQRGRHGRHVAPPLLRRPVSGARGHRFDPPPSPMFGAAVERPGAADGSGPRLWEVPTMKRGVLVFAMVLGISAGAAAAQLNDPHPIPQASPVVLGTVVGSNVHSVTIETSEGEQLTLETDSRTVMP